MLVTREKTVRYIVEMTSEQRENIIAGLAGLTPEFRETMTDEQIQAISDLRASLANA